MANNEDIKKDPCGLTNYKDENHRNPRYESGRPPKTTFIEMRGNEERGNFTDIQVKKSGDSKVEEGNGQDIMDGKGQTIKAFKGGINDNKGMGKE